MVSFIKEKECQRSNASSVLETVMLLTNNLTFSWSFPLIQKIISTDLLSIYFMLSFFRFLLIRGQSLTKRERLKQEVISVYTELEIFLKSEKYPKILREELEAANVDFLTHLSLRKTDLERSDHGIVITGKKKIFD